MAVAADAARGGGDLFLFDARAAAQQWADAWGSAGKLWCGTCHDPHGEPVNRKEQMKQICESCHATAQLAATLQPDQTDCVACHMPSRRAEDVSHAAVTDHRIARWPGPIADVKTAKFIAVWHDPKAEFAERNLGLALFNTGKQRQSAADFEQAFRCGSCATGRRKSRGCY